MVYDQTQWERARRSEGMSQAEARASWQDAVAKKELHQITKNGRLCLVEPAPTEVSHERVQKWRRT
eukprot:3902205-Lingulodinium_polyedra.AAC.1